jgi:hypothetical protein
MLTTQGKSGKAGSIMISWSSAVPAPCGAAFVLTVISPQLFRGYMLHDSMARDASTHNNDLRRSINEQQDRLTD